MIIAENPVLNNAELVLTPATLEESKDYLLLLAMKDRYNKTPKEELERGLEFVKHVWFGGVNGELCGILMICYLPEMKWWTLDAYRDDSLDNSLGDYSYKSGKLVSDWFLREHPEAKELYTMHRTVNKAATKMCLRLGFRPKYTNQEFTILTKER